MPVLAPFIDVLAVLPLVSMVWGNLAAIRQTSFRRMIAYSSIAHAGYLFFALLGAGPGRAQAVIFYVVVYGIMNVLAFTVLPRGTDDERSDRLESLQGLYQRRPFAALMLAIRCCPRRHPAPARLRRQVPRVPQRDGRGPHRARGARPDRQLPRPVLLPARHPVHVHERADGPAAGHPRRLLAASLFRPRRQSCWHSSRLVADRF
jgi:hypothetical protein